MASGKLALQAKKWAEKYQSEQERSPSFTSHSGIQIKPLYTPEDMDPEAYLEDLGFPGETPFTRGIHPTMYRGRLWTIRQLAGYGTPDETNRRFRFLLSHGATGLNCVFDYPTLRGYDSDAPEAEGDTGQGGVSINSIADMEDLFTGIPLDKISVSLVASNPITAVTLMAMYLVVAKKRGIAWDLLSGTIQNDFLMETTITTAPQVLPPASSFKLSTDLVEYCAKHVPKWNPISYTGYSYRESGADAVQEVAIVFANALASIEEMLNRGYSPEFFVPRLSFSFSADNDFFEEIAKYRAARRLWCKLISSKYHSKDKRTLALRYHVQTAGWTLTVQEPFNNTIRAAYQALAAVLGGAQSIHVDGYDEALCIPSEQAALLPLRTQQILQNEMNVTHTIDPLGGSYFLESLTNEMESKIGAYLQQIEELGGIITAVEKGWLHREISTSAYTIQKQVEKAQRKIVGVNFIPPNEQRIEIFRPDPKSHANQLINLAKLKQTRNSKAVAKSLKELNQRLKTGENVMDAIIRAVEARATLGEISNSLRREYGTWTIPLF